MPDISLTPDRLAAFIARHPVSGAPDHMRKAFAALAGTGPAGETVTHGGIRCLRFGAGPPALWLHGGGYVFGAPETHATPAHRLAEAAGRSILLPAYRRAPEHAWPAPVEDACTVLDSFDAPLPVMGDSAGGHLALAVARRRPGRVSALALISPNTDRTGQSTTRRTNTATDFMNTDTDDARLAAMAMPGLAPDDPDASPLVADLSGLPPVYVTASTREILLDDTLLLIRALGCAGVPVTADITGAPCHMWTLWPDLLEDARMTLGRIATFLASVCQMEDPA